MRSIKLSVIAAPLLFWASGCSAQDVPPVYSTGNPIGSAEVPTSGEEDIGMFAQSLLGAHNDAREKVGAPALRWSKSLANDAADYARVLADKNKIEHASEDARNGAGENLWIGTSGFYSTRAMIDAFLTEEQYFKPGIFPDVSTTGNWIDVGHYTQIIWKDTQKVGCAVTNNAQNDVLVCRYLPSGNWRGVAIP